MIGLLSGAGQVRDDFVVELGLLRSLMEQVHHGSQKVAKLSDLVCFFNLCIVFNWYT